MNKEKDNSFRDKVIYAIISTVIGGIILFLSTEFIRPHVSPSNSNGKYLNLLEEADNELRNSPPNFYAARVLYLKAKETGKKNNQNIDKALDGIKRCNEALANRVEEKNTHESSSFRQSRIVNEVKNDYTKIKFVNDQRDGKNYPVTIINNLVWLCDNLNFEAPNSFCFRNRLRSCNDYGRLYNWYGAKKACEGFGENWRLPTDKEWTDVFMKYGGYSGYSLENDEKGEPIMKNTGDPYRAVKALIFSGESSLHLEYGGARNYVAQQEEWLRYEDAGFYWSSTEIHYNEYMGFSHAWYYIVDKDEIFRSWNNKNSAYFSCRCVKEIE